MKQVDRIREHVFQKYIQPAREIGKKTVTLIASDIHKELNLVNRMPNVCNAIDRKFEELYQVKIINHQGPKQGCKVWTVDVGIHD